MNNEQRIILPTANSQQPTANSQLPTHNQQPTIVFSRSRSEQFTVYGLKTTDNRQQYSVAVNSLRLTVNGLQLKEYRKEKREKRL